MKYNIYHSIILARGGSKGIKNKNLKKINTKPLLYWSINQSLKAKNINKTWVSSDSEKILNYAKSLGAETIKRPKNLSCDNSSSESGWIHAINEIKKRKYKFNKLVAIQATSPLRSKKDFDKAINLFEKEKYCSLFSSVKADDYYFSWKFLNGKLIPNYDIFLRTKRQNLNSIYLENGSFFIFDTKKFLKFKNRLFGKVGNYVQSKQCQFQIDSLEDLRIVNHLLKIK